MKSKKLYHPKFYLRIIKRNKNILELEFQDNEFENDGKRKIKRCIYDCKENAHLLLNDSIEILNDINRNELHKTNNYIETQKKVLKYHISKQKHDSIRTVRDSIKMMKEFKMKFNIYDF